MSFETDTQSTGFENPFSAHGRAPGTPSPIARRTAEIDQQQLHQPDSQESPHERGEVDVSQEEEGTGFGSSRALTQKSHTAHTQSIRSGFHTSTTQSHSQRVSAAVPGFKYCFSVNLDASHADTETTSRQCCTTETENGTTANSDY